MNHKCCDCSYDSLFVKEVIRTYCGDTKSTGKPIVPIPPEPEIPVDPEIPVGCNATEFLFEFPAYHYELHRAVDINQNYFPDVSAFLALESDTDQVEMVKEVCSQKMNSIYTSFSESIDEVGLVTSTRFGTLGQSGTSIRRGGKDAPPEKYLSRYNLYSTEGVDVITTNFTVSRNPDNDDITFDVGDPPVIRDLVGATLVPAADLLVELHQGYLNTFFPVEVVSFGDLIRGVKQIVKPSEGVFDLRRQYDSRFPSACRLVVNLGGGFFIKEKYFVTGAEVTNHTYQGYAAYTSQYFVNRMRYREPHLTSVSDTSLVNAQLDFTIVKRLMKIYEHPSYKHLNEEIWIDNRNSYAVSNLGSI